MHSQWPVSFLIGGILWFGLAVPLGCHKASSAVVPVEQAPDSPTRVTAGLASGTSGGINRPGPTSSESAESEVAQTLPPRARVAEDIHDFGRMNAHLTASHSFVIENIGHSPLQLTAAETTCSCTVGDVPRDPIPPGQSAQIRVQWKTKPTEKRFRETITLKTNDPEQPELQFTIAGDVGREVDAEPLEFGDVAPDSTRERVSLITSTILDHFAVTDVTCSVPGLVWDLTPATAEELQKLGARSGWQLRARLPDDMPLGDFQGALRFQLEVPSDGASPESTSASDVALEDVQYEIQISGKVLRRIAVYGPKIDWSGTITLGAVGQGKGYSANYVVKVRDPEKNLPLLSKHVEPEWMQVDFEPYAVEDSRHGLYRLKLHIPADAPVSDFTTGRSGKIQLKFDHPRAQSLDLNVVFSIVSAGRPTTK